MNKDNVPETHGGGGVGAAVLIGLGLLLLLNNFGLLSWTIWYQLWEFWPILLILTGIQMVLGRSLISRSLMTLLTLLAIAYLAAMIVAPENPRFEKWFKKSFPQIPEIQIPEKWEEELPDKLTQFSVL